MARQKARLLFRFFALVVAQGLRYSSPLAGVSISSRGFVALLSNPSGERLFPVVLSRRDTERVVSAEAHTLLQLLQGIDTGTSVLPPNALRLCFSPADEPPTALGSEDVALDSVRVSKAPKDAALDDDDDQSSSSRCDSTVAAEKAPALAAALEKLGIFATAEESAKLLVDYADSDGTFDRYAFSLALEAARRAMKPPQSVSTTLVATDGREVLASPFTSLALALRYPRTTISIEDDVFESDDAVDAQDARTIFPLLQTVEDLKVDAARIAAQSARLFEETL